MDVLTMQQGLAVWSQSREGQSAGAQSPGRRDGAWGPTTRASLRVFLSVVAPEVGLDPVAIENSYASAATNTRAIELPAPIEINLQALAGQYPQEARVPATIGPSTLPVITPSTQGGAVWPWVLGGVLLFGTGWFVWTRLR